MKRSQTIFRFLPVVAACIAGPALATNGYFAHGYGLAVSSLHHYLVREGLRTRVSLVIETGEAREVHHFSLLIGYGASAVNPYLAFETLDGMIRDGLLASIDHNVPSCGG